MMGLGRNISETQRQSVLIYFKMEINCKTESHNNEICALSSNSNGCSWSRWIIHDCRPSQENGNKNGNLKKKQPGVSVQPWNGDLFAGEEQPEPKARGAVT